MPNRSFSRPIEKKHIVSLCIGGVVGVVGTICFLSNNVDPLNFLLGLATFYVALVIGVCFHELGHACGAILAGGSVQYIQLGKRYAEWKPWEIRFLGFLWLINSAPFSGSAHISFGSPVHFRLRQCWMISCGPLVNCAFLIGGLLLIEFGQVDRLFPYAVGWCAANIYLLFVSLVPRLYRMDNRIRANDGLLFLKTLRYTDQDVAQQILFGEIAHEIGTEAVEAQKLSFSELVARHAATPSKLGILWCLGHRLFDTQDPQYVPYVLELIDHPKLPARIFPLIIDMYLTWQLHTGPPEHPEITDQLSQRMLAVSDSISTRGTRGAVLVDLGRVEEGKAVLQDVLAKTNSTIDKVYSNVFLALAAKTEGHLDLAAEHALAARKIDPACPVLKRLSNLIPAS